MEETRTDVNPTEFLKRLASKTSLHISRVPKKTLAEFKAWAKEEFENDYGMAFKWQWDYFTGTLAPKESQITLAIEELTVRMDAVEGKSSQPEKKVIHLGGGNRIEKRS